MEPRIVRDDGMILDNVTHGWEAVARCVWTFWVTGKEPPTNIEQAWEDVLAEFTKPEGEQ